MFLLLSSCKEQLVTQGTIVNANNPLPGTCSRPNSC